MVRGESKMKEKLKVMFKGSNKDFIVSLLLIVIAVIIFVIPVGKNKKTEIDYSGIKEISDLMTLKCYYHNVLEDEKLPEGLFKYGLFQYGYKKFWLEYEGFVEVGIDVGEVEISQPDKNGVVRVKMPNAIVMEQGCEIENIGELIVDTGEFTKINVEEQLDAYSIAQAKMIEEAKQDQYILKKAENNAKEIIGNFINKISEINDNDITIEWIQK